MIVLTGAAGFIGSCLLGHLEKEGYADLVAVDDFGPEAKKPNLEGKNLREKVHRNDFAQWLDENHQQVQFIFHIGARTDTSEFDRNVLNRLNLHYTQMLWDKCVSYGLPLVYASSAATYGAGEHGYKDDESALGKLKPLNPYGESKNDFDIWALKQKNKPFFWAGLKFFNVYGPNEYHKGRMASVIMHAHRQVLEKGHITLFRSHRPDYADGMQSRDFVYVKDVVKVCQFLMEERPQSGIFNLGSGEARPFLHLAQGVFKALGKKEDIRFVDTPEDIRDKYQYYTCAEMSKLRNAGYSDKFYTLEEGIKDYVSNYLNSKSYM